MSAVTSPQRTPPTAGPRVERAEPHTLAAIVERGIVAAITDAVVKKFEAARTSAPSAETEAGGTR